MDLNYSLATLNATLNGLAAVLLFAGWRAIKGKKSTLGRRPTTSHSLFLDSLHLCGGHLTDSLELGCHGAWSKPTLYAQPGFEIRSQ